MNAIAPPLPSIFELARHVQALSDAHDHLDVAEVAGDLGRKLSREENAIWLERWMAIQELIVTMPAVTLADTVAQLNAAIVTIESEYKDDWPQAAKNLTEKLQRVMVSSMRAVARSAALDPASVGCLNLDDRHNREFPPSLLDGLTAATADSPDAELIRLCDRLVEIHNAWVKLGETIRDDKDREAAGAPLHQEWLDIRARFFDMKRPVTREGAAAMARAASVNGDRDRLDRTMATDFGEWLALAACAYLADAPTPIIDYPLPD
jgi:hypothetical protein